VGAIYTQGDPGSNIDSSLVGADFLYRNTRIGTNRSMIGNAWVQKSDNEGVSGDDTAWSAVLSFPSRLGLEGGRPLGDMRRFVEELRAVPRAGELPPVVVAGLRKKMVALSAEIAEGVVFANASRSHMPESLAALPEEKRGDPGFFVGNMIPTCISEDRKAAAAVNRKTLSGYVNLPNYRNYWKEAGYVEEMEAVEKALANRERDKIPSLLSDRWLADSTLFGTAAEVREGVEAWYEAGVRTPMLVPSSAVGNQLKAFEELFAIF
jgi:alkanesulfonate monooxygenase SsuD/methylene tetrahydromethanopterin reductase-like flavin-dependent oxidoreductase (luciferase family)